MHIILQAGSQKIVLYLPPLRYWKYLLHYSTTSIIITTREILLQKCVAP